ncbi:MAG: HD domain-containing protein [Coriobacteriales bacterium]|nr:HD domain-containing protein [Coriobacteriales bacterium]
MGKQFVAELVDGARVDSPFVLRNREMRTARSGEAYLSVELADRTGRVQGVVFRPDRRTVAVPTGTAVETEGRVSSYRGQRRIIVESLRPAEQWDRADMIASAARPIQELVAELRELVRSISDERLKAVARRIFGDRAFFKRFCDCPGSQSYHHAFVGGLLEHTVRVAAHASALAPGYEGIDRDLIVSAALLHDIGKVDELDFDTSIEFTDSGRLIGHVVLGVQRVHAATVREGLDDCRRSHLEHAILSHHGELEWGSPKRPCSVEALLLHHIDNLDAKTTGFLEALHGASLIDEPWTDAFNLFRRPLFAPSAVEDDRSAHPGEDAQYHRRTA